MAKMAASMAESGEDVFRKIFKFYKKRDQSLDLSDVTDFRSREPRGQILPTKLDPAAVSDEDAARVGLQPIRDWRAFGLQGYPGFIFISDPFLRTAQPFWVHQCLKTYPQKPNVCNLDLHMDPRHTQDIWGQSAPVLSSSASGKRQPKTLLEKLRWVTLGYHYNWDTKTYSASNYTPFPADLRSLSVQVAAACGFQGFSAEAGILNFYRSDSSLGIHVDESELDHSRPLLSFSFGQSAIFLLGGRCRQDPPTAMLMHSGDVMVMSGQSRLLYHAVPRILPAPQSLVDTLRDPRPPSPPPTLVCGSVLEPVSPEDWAVCSRYVQTSRVNVTIRQVLAPGQSFPEAPPPPAQRPEGGGNEYGGGMKRTRSDGDDAAET